MINIKDIISPIKNDLITFNENLKDSTRSDVNLVNIVIDSSSMTDEQSCAADLNEDETINILDIVGLVNIVIEG